MSSGKQNPRGDLVENKTSSGKQNNKRYSQSYSQRYSSSGKQNQ
jgi:hypothetical protein